ncbi:HAD family hydrolase [Pseudomonas sp. ABC1]|uniref:HAD family hydrolase n=1 Tax=Pseudomonas sp. ABC1 TaxID=2748080 RepID=UPI0015C3529A|nr:HAD family hydrolase [Pseudomonas sp. ABC1]QLF94928.1 HAD family hydrolase [Pseudomonas sp. ABC1]
MQAENSRPALAVFDFDGTLTDRHTFWRYMRFIVGPRAFWLNMIPLLPQMLGVLLGMVPLMQARLAFIERYLGGLSQEQEREHARAFIAGHLPLWLRPEALRRLQWHQSKGHVTALVSNSPENYLQPWGKSVGFDHVCGTRLATGAQRLTGGIDGRNCVEQEKMTRLRGCVANLDTFDIYAYGDSSGDAALLEAATFPFYRNWY